MEHYHRTIQGWFPEEGEELFTRVIEKAPKTHYVSAPPLVAVEIGVWKGQSTVFAAVEAIRQNASVRWYAVDHFRGSNERAHQEDPDLPHLQDIFLRNIRPYQNVKVLPFDSVDAPEELPPGERVDFLFVDGSHEFEDVLCDLLCWRPRMRTHGIVAGDDWQCSSVRRAVETYFGKEMSKVEVWGNRVWVYGLARDAKRPRATR